MNAQTPRAGVQAEGTELSRHRRMADQTNPDYYQRDGAECIDFTEEMPFCLGCAFKYAWRLGEKDDPKLELGKMRWYVCRQIDLWDRWSIKTWVEGWVKLITASSTLPHAVKTDTILVSLWMAHIGNSTYWLKMALTDIDERIAEHSAATKQRSTPRSYEEGTPE